MFNFNFGRLFIWQAKENAARETIPKLKHSMHPLADRIGWRFHEGLWSFAPTPGADRRPLLNLGCGGHFHPASINVDVVANDPSVLQHDISDKLPFSSETFEVVYHSHVLEHLPKQQAVGFMRECYRVLAPGGRIRVAVPDLEQICKIYVDLVDSAASGDCDAAARYDWIVIELLDQMTRQKSGGEMLEYWRRRPMPAAEFVFARVGQEALNAIASEGQSPAENLYQRPAVSELSRFLLSGEIHRWMYDRFSLGRLLMAAGFRDPIQVSADSSDIEDFSAYGLDTMLDGRTRKPDSLFMEAARS